MKQLLIASFDMEIGGVERSLISMLNSFDYTNYRIDLMLYSHTGEFMSLLPGQPELLPESKVYKTFRMSIGEIIKTGNFPILFSRLAAKYKASRDNSAEAGYKQMQYMWKYALPFLPPMKQEYDVAISYLWPHYFVAEKVKANIKVAWIHTDFSTVETDLEMDIQMWRKFDHIIAVSEECKNTFIHKYPVLSAKVEVIENVSSPAFIHKLAEENVPNPLEDDSRFKLLTVARFSHAKGIDNAVYAMKVLKDKGFKDIAWYIVGYGGDEKKIKRLIKQNDLEDQFILLGKKTNPYPYMKTADLYVQPSRYEGKAVTVREAQILGKPVMITNYPTAKSQVEKNIDGYICELSVEGIAQGIEELYVNSILRIQLGENCEKMNYNNCQGLEKLYQLA